MYCGRHLNRSHLQPSVSVTLSVCFDFQLRSAVTTNVGFFVEQGKIGGATVAILQGGRSRIVKNSKDSKSLVMMESIYSVSRGGERK